MSSTFEKDQDFFDQLPDPIVLLILNKVHDAKSLCLSMSVCKRFYSIIPEVDTVCLSIPEKKCDCVTKKSDEKRKSFKNLVSKVLVKPFKFFLQLLKSKSGSCDSGSDDEYSYILPHLVLKPLRDVRSLEIKLPKASPDFHLNFLKYKAEFGSQLQSCVILGATEISKIDQSHEFRSSNDNAEAMLSQEQEQEPIIADDELKLRIVWMITCLISACTRHQLIEQTLNDHQTLRKLMFTDGDKRGTLSMNHEQIEDYRKNMDSGIVDKEKLLERSKVPDLRMKMWYVPELKMPSSDCVMKGATLVVIKPNEEGKEVVERGDWLVKAFDGEEEEEKVFGEAMRKLLKSKSRYTLEMNSF